MKNRFILMGSCLALLAVRPVARAQSVWNAGTSDWFTPGNWTPSGVPTSSIDARINNGGTAQITTAGAAAKTLILGNGVGESGEVSVSGAGALTVSTTGFFLTVGEAGTGTLNVSAGGTVVNAPVLYIGDMAGSAGTVTVTGVGSSMTAQFQVEVGRSGTGTLNVLDGASFIASGAAFAVGDGTGTGHVKVDGTTGVNTTLTVSSINIGGGTLGSTADVTITGANAKLNASAGLDVGSAGNGTLTMSAGAKGNATALLIGDDGTGTVTLDGTGTAFTLTGLTAKVTVGNTTTANLNIQAGATLSSVAGTVGQTPGGAGTVTITGASSAWTISGNNGFLTGRSGLAGGTAAINILNGGKLTATNLSAYTDTAIKVDGTGSQLSLPNDSGASTNKSLFLGTVGTNKLDVTNGGALVTGSSILTTTAGSSFAINLAGAGSSWTATPLVGTLTTQFGGAGTASFTVDDHATFTYTQNGIFNVDATGTGTASLTVKNGAIFDVGTISTLLRIGQDGTGSLTIDSGGTVNTAHAYIGEDTGAVGTAAVSGVGTTFNANDLQVGTIGGQGTVTISGGATLKGDAVIGGTTGGGQMTVTGIGTTWTVAPGLVNNFVFVEGNGSLKILAGATVNGNSLSAGTGASNGTILIDGSGTHANVATLFTDGTGSITIQNQAVVTGTGAVLGQNEGANTAVTIDGVGTQWNMTGNGQIGNHGKVTLNIQNGAHVTSGHFYLGYDQNVDSTGGNGIVNVTGVESSLASTSYLRVADYFFTAGTLTISQGGTVTSVSGGTASTASGIASTNNATGTIVVTGASSSWTNTGDIYVGKSGATGVGTLTVANGGTVSISGATSINATSTLNIGTGGAAGTFSAASVANSGLIHFNHTDSVTYSTSTSGTGVLTKDGTGTLIITGVHTYTGATTINGGIFRVNGTLGNTAVTINTGATLGGSGTIVGAVNIANGGILAPGNSPGTITLGALTLNSGSIENYELGTPNTPGGATNDLTEVNGDFTLDGTLNVTAGAGFGLGTYRLFDYTGTLTNNVLNLGVVPGTFNYSIDTSVAGQVNLVVAGAAQYCDGLNMTANNVVNGGTGTWNAANTNWTNVTGSANGTWQSGTAIFNAGSGTVTTASLLTATDIQFQTGAGAYTINVAALISSDQNNPGLNVTGPGVQNTSGIQQTLLIGTPGLFDGVMQFSNSASAGSNVVYHILGYTGPTPTAPGNFLLFRNTSTASQATIFTDGTTNTTGEGGVVRFFDTSTAGSATITNNGATTNASVNFVYGGGETAFQDSSTASTSQIANGSSLASSADGGLTRFHNTSTAGSATITNNAGSSANFRGGITTFGDDSTAASATINNLGSAAAGATGGSTYFFLDSGVTGATAGTATINNFGGTGTNAGGGTTNFGTGFGFSFDGGGGAGHATMNNFAGTADSALGGSTIFTNDSTAGTASFTNSGAGIVGAAGGSTIFRDSATAASATFQLNAGTAGGIGDVHGGAVEFHNTSTAANATFTLQGGGLSGSLGGAIDFYDTSTAATSLINIQGGTATSSHDGGRVDFHNSSTAGQATIHLFGATADALIGYSFLSFDDTSNAGTATINVAGSGVAFGAGGNLFFNGSASAQQSSIHVTTGTVANASSGEIFFGTSSTAGTATITVDGSTAVSIQGGYIEFQDTSTAAAAHLIANGGTGGGQGGLIEIRDNATGGTSQVEINGNAALDISSSSTLSGVTIGSLAGSGNAFLGSKVLTVGSNTLSTTFSGVLQDNGSSGNIAAGGGLTKIGATSLNLTGTSTYTGATVVNGGTLFVNGSLTATSLVTVNNGGTLGGSGTIIAPVTIANGGTLAPGNSPGTITVGTLTLNSGSIENYDLGNPNTPGGATNDLTIVNGNLILDGTLNINAGAGFGAGVYRLFNYTGTLTNNILDLGTLPGGFNYTIDVGTANQVNLDVNIIGATFTYWNGSHTTPNGAVNGGTGTWNNVTANWTDVTGNASGAWTNGGVAHFTGPAGTATLGDNITAAEIQFLAGSGAYTITAVPGTTLTLNGLGVTNNSGITQNFSASATANGGGRILFVNSATAGTQTTYTAAGGIASGQNGGNVVFHNTATAGSATFVNNGATVAGGAMGGYTEFDNAATASAAQITNNGGTFAAAKGGTTFFKNTSTAASSTIDNNAGTVAGTIGVNTGAGTTVFQDTASAGSATIKNHPVTTLSADTGSTFFHDNATAATSHITNDGGILATFLNGGGGQTEFFETSTAGNSTITNAAGTLVGVGGGTTGFVNDSKAGAATITNAGGTLAGGQGGVTFLDDTATASTATIVNQGGVAGARGGRVAFLGTSTAAGSTLIANGGSGGGPGGEVEFFDDSTGGTAAVQLFGNGQLDISGHNALGVALGSIEGSGLVFLGARNLTVGNTNGNKLFSIVIQHGGFSSGVGGSFTKVGTGLLDLTGHSTYTGATTVNGGTLRVNGSLGTTTVTVNNSATLAGTGTIGGPVTIASGGALAPGSSGIGTLATGAMLLSSGSLLHYELAAPGISDLTNVTGNLTLDGTLNLTALPGFGLGTYKIFTYTGLLTDNTLNIGTRPPGFLLTVDTSVAGEVDLDVAGGGPLPIAYFNGSHVVPNGVVNGGSGPWDNSTTNWTDATGNVLGTWGGGVGIFQGTAGTVTLGSDIDFTALQFSTNGYLIEGAGHALYGVGPVVVITDPGVGATIDAIIHAPGGLTKLGTGSLFLDGSLFGNLQVLQGLLGGHGAIFGNLLNAATVSPGHSPGQLKVSGNYTQTPNALLKIEIGGRALNEYDLLTVGGTAALDGALQLVRLNHFKLKRHQSVAFLTAAGGVKGEFANVVSDFTSDTILQPQVVYHQNSVALEAMQGLFASLDGLTPNQKAVAQALDRAARDPRADAIFEYLDYRQMTKLPGDFDKIAPEELTSIFTIATSLATVQSQNIQRRNDDIRSGANGFTASGLAVNGSGPSYGGAFLTGAAGPNGYELRDDGKEVKEMKEATPEEKRWGVFLSGTGEWVSVGDTENARGYDLTSGGFTLGVDYKVTPNLAIGLAAGYTGTSADLTDRGRVWVNGGKLGLYSTYFSGGWYADAAVFGGYNSYSSRRSALQGEARGDTEGGEFNALLGTGYDFKKGNLTFGPTASFNYTYLGSNEFTERGSLAPLQIHGGKGESLRTALGFKASYDWKVGGIFIKPEIRAAWQHEFGDAAYALDSSFANGAGNSLRVNGPQLGRDSVLLGAGFAIQWSERCSTYFYYDGELGRTNYQSSSVTGGLRIAF